MVSIVFYWMATGLRELRGIYEKSKNLENLCSGSPGGLLEGSRGALGAFWGLLGASWGFVGAHPVDGQKSQAVVIFGLLFHKFNIGSNSWLFWGGGSVIGDLENSTKEPGFPKLSFWNVLR